jgi:soluble lytic murein transglycosylase
MSLARACIFSTVAALTVAAMTAWLAGAQAQSTVRQTNIRVLSAADHDLFTRAFDAASHGDWVGARNLAGRGQSSVARQMLEWRYALDPDSGAGFAEIDAVIKSTQGWPMRGTLQSRAEQMMIPGTLTPGQVIDWFGGRDPNSSLGKIRLGEALVATGQESRGARLIRDGWIAGSFDPSTELAIVQRDGSFITDDDDRARLNALLWKDQLADARHQMSRVDEHSRQVALARIALDGGLLRARAALAKVKNSSDPNLLYDWSRALRVGHKDDSAHAMLLRIAAATLVRDHPAAWWSECSIQARDALTAGDARTAMALVNHAGLSGGEPYAEQQFMGGFIALRFLKEPKTAQAWFQRLEGGVSRPISKGRARYWQGRAYEQMGDTASAITEYRLAATFPETFYGQVALARLEPSPVLHLSETPADTAPPAELDGDILMPQIKIAAELGLATSLRQFLERDVALNPSAGHIKRLIISLGEWGYPEIGVRLAKTESYTGTWLPEQLYPVIQLPAYKGPGSGPEPALVLGLIRQETEFDANAVSVAGARGLIQLMTGTARAAAKIAGLPWRPNQLQSDTSYNIQLGMVDFIGHVSRYNGSLVLAMASYNAGPGNARKWIVANGDPRGQVDPIDWIEQIPFGETRNYVQRVLENTAVYRNRLAGRDTPLRILADLYGPANQPAVLKAAN